MEASDEVRGSGRGEDEQLEDPNFNPWLSPSKIEQQRQIAADLQREGPQEMGETEEPEHRRDQRGGRGDDRDDPMKDPGQQNDPDFVDLPGGSERADPDHLDHEQAEYEHEQQRQEEERQREKRQESNERTVDLDPKYRREVWRERQREACEANGLDERRTGRMRGEVEDVEEIGDQKTVVVTNDEGEYSLVDVDKSADLDVGDNVKVDQGRSQTAEPDIENHEPEQSRGLER